MPYLWAFAAGSLAAGLEFAYAHGLVTSWWRAAWWLVPLAVLVNFGIYQLLRTGFGWLSSMVLFSAVVAAWRIGLAFGVTHEPITTPHVAAALVMVVGVGIKLFWR